MANPRTGETWHAPVRAPQYDALLPEDWDGTPRAFVVGERAGFDIVIGLSSLDPEWHHPDASPSGVVGVLLYEIRDDVAYEVPCPSARTTDPCDPSLEYGGVRSGPMASDVFYDSLTFPTAIALDRGLIGRLTSGDSDPGGYPGGYPMTGLGLLAEATPDAFEPYGAPTSAILSTLPGGATVVREEVSSNITGVTNALYAVRAPFGGLFVIDPNVPTYDDGSFVLSGVAWEPSATAPSVLPIDDGRFWVYPAAGYQCDLGIAYSIDHTHAASEWVKVATDDLGRDIFAPVEGGNRVALAVYTRMQEIRGWEGGADLYAARWPIIRGESGLRAEPTEDYPFATYEEFVDQYGVLTYEIAPGTWAIAARAMASIFECA